MLIAVYTIIMILLLLPLLAEVRMVIRAILAGAMGARASRELLRSQSLPRRLTLTGLAPHLPRLQREYGQYLRMQLFAVLVAAAAIGLVVLFVIQRQAIPALVVCLVYCVGSFACVSLVHAHAGYDPETRTTRYDRPRR